MGSDARRVRTWVRIVRSAALVVLGFFVLSFLVVMLFEDSFIYFPSRDGDWDRPARSGGKVEDVWLTASDGVKLHGWHVKGRGDLTILFFHGNAGNLSDRWDWIEDLSSLGDVLAVDYRGYGRSDGRPDEKGIFLDAEAAYRWLTGTRGVPERRVVVYGKSLGGAAACELGSRFPVGGVILQSVFTNAKDMAKIMMPFFPAGWFLRTRFANDEKIAKIAAPKLLIHSRDDEMIPYWMAEKLHAAAPEPRTLATFEGAGHNDLIGSQRRALLETIRKFLDSLR